MSEVTIVHLEAEIFMAIGGHYSEEELRPEFEGYVIDDDADFTIACIRQTWAMPSNCSLQHTDWTICDPQLGAKAITVFWVEWDEEEEDDER